MKKHGLTKILGIMLLLIVITSFILNGRNDTKYFIGLMDIPYNYIQALYYFFYLTIYTLFIGGFYGVLNKIPAYQKLVDNIGTKFKPSGKKIIFVIILLMAIITALTGMTLPMLIIVPFIITIILAMGYDKLVAISATVVSMMVGYVGGTHITFYDPSTQELTTFESFVGLDQMFGNLFPKLLLLFAGITLLICYVNNHIKSVENKKVKYELEKNDELKVKEVSSDYSKIHTWPIIVSMSLLFVILILGLVPWNYLFQTTIFEKIHTWLIELSIKDFAIIPNIITSNLYAFGNWYADGESMTYMILCVLLLVFTIINAIIGKVKLNDIIENFKEGMKKFLPIVGIILLSYTVLITAYKNGFFENIVESYGKFNYGISSLLTFLGCILNVDLYYISGGVFSPILELITDESVYASVALLFQGIYGIFSIVGPTSIILIFILSYMNVPYLTWLKYIWRFILALIILLALVTLLIVLL